MNNDLLKSKVYSVKTRQVYMIPLKMTMLWSAGTMVMTLVHHLYGAIIYDEPFRLHVAIFAIPVIVVLLGTYAGYEKVSNILLKKIFLVIFFTVSILFSVAAIGLYEGGYNHVIKNILYFGGISTEILDQIYPSVYELPNDFVFELTGIAQFVTGLLCGFEILRLPIKRWFELLNDPAWDKSR
jgi:hypothetical protein